MILYSNAFNDEDIEFARKKGLGLEVLQYSNPVFLDNFNENHPKITDIMKNMTGYSMHGAYFDTFYTSVDPLICEVSKKRFLQCVQAASFHSINRLVFHSVYRKYFDGYSKLAIDVYLKKAIDFWKEFEASIPDGMTIYIENVEDDDPEVFIKIIEGIGSPKISCCFDIGHAFCNSSVPVEKWVSVLGSFIGHVHLHDNDGTSDQHLPLGKGNIPLFDVINKIIEKADSSVPFVLECDVVESMKWLVDKGLVP